MGCEFGSHDYEPLAIIDVSQGFPKVRGVTAETLRRWREEGRSRLHYRVIGEDDRNKTS